MEPRDLAKFWDAPDNSKLTAKQLSIRLPMHVAAKISALCDLFPRKNKTEIIGDLLATAIDQLVAALPSVNGKLLGYNNNDQNDPIYEDVGPRSRFRSLTEMYLKKLESEADIKEPVKSMGSGLQSCNLLDNSVTQLSGNSGDT